MANKVICLKCRKAVSNNQNSIQCDDCNNWIHKKCIKMTMDTFNLLTNDHSLFYYCDFCQFYKCNKCKKHVYDHELGICCDICNEWMHQKCTHLNLKTYRSLQNDDSVWYCKSCQDTNLPFSSLDKKDFSKLFEKPSKNNLEKLVATLTTSVVYSSTCKVCERKLAKPSKGIPCKTCKTLIHRKCCNIPKLNATLKDPKILENWECKMCQEEKFPLAQIDNKELLTLSFNSNFDCHCKIGKSQLISSSDHNFKFRSEKHSDQDNFDSFSDPGIELENTFQLSLNFDYFETHQFHKLLKGITMEKSLGILHTNICSLQHNFENLQLLITQLDYKFGIIALSETWNPKDKSHKFNAGDLEGYQKYTGTSGTTLKSGCGFYVRNDIKFVPRKDLDLSILDNNNEYQSKWIELIDGKKMNTLVGVYYRHPRKSSDDTFNNDLKGTLGKISKENKTKIICGDFNYNLLNFKKCDKISTFINVMFEECLQATILEPTRFVGSTKPSLIDNIFVNSISQSITSGNIIDKISDHMPSFVIIEQFISAKKKRKFRKRNMKQFDKDSYISDLQNIPFMDMISEDDDVNTAYEKFHKHFVETIDRHAPYRTLSKKESKLSLKPWITTGIQKSISKKNKLYKKLLNTSNNFWYRRYKAHRDLINTLIKLSKKTYYQKYFSECAKNSKKTWTGINKVLNRDKNINDEIFLNIGGKTIHDQTKVADAFNNYFINVAQKLSNELGEPNTKFQDYLKNPNKSSFCLHETEPGEVLKYIQQINIGKSPDIYGISPQLVRIADVTIAYPLANIFNKSFRQGVFPDMLKSAFVLPIHKADSKMVTANYRPISILPIISKILEKIMHKRMMEFLKKFDILDKHQFGFQKNCSTEHAILDLYSKIVSAIENKEKSCSIFLDFAKAFDTVNHDILIKKLEYYGIRGIYLNWFKSYLETRKQCVQVGQDKSDSLIIKCGVPQGSVLGPLLFLLYINDISSSSNILKFHLFADDTSIFYSHKETRTLEKNINDELKNVSNWLIANKLSLNVKKSNLIIFNHSNCAYDKINIKINNKFLEEKSSAKYLGIIIDSKLTWKPHIDYVNTKLAKGIGLLAKLRHFIPPTLIRNLFNAFIQPHIDYGLTAWGSAFATQLHPIDISLKKAVRICSFKKRNEPTAPLFNALGTLPLIDNIQYQQSRFIWKCVNMKHPSAIQEIFNSTQKRTKVSTNKTLFRPYCRTTIAQNFALNAGIKLWNQIPHEITQKEKLKSFSDSIKLYIIDKKENV